MSYVDRLLTETVDKEPPRGKKAERVTSKRSAALRLTLNVLIY